MVVTMGITKKILAGVLIFSFAVISSALFGQEQQEPEQEQAEEGPVGQGEAEVSTEGEKGGGV
ncbi:MAG: hypothetical protein ACLFNZ_06900, partial [Spirochaetaceae bacterium]